jgi:hypothetical protein
VELRPLFTWDEFVAALRESDLRYPDLRVVQMAQAIVESGRGTSQLYSVAGNPYGLKWRNEMQAHLVGRIFLSTPTEPKPVEWCLFRTPEVAIAGYWNFINRSPYRGFERFAANPLGYLKHIHGRGYATDANYVGKVRAAFAEARELLSG